MSTGNETWIHHFQPETKLQFREWNQSHDFTTQEVQDSFLSRVSDGTVFWDMEGVTLVSITETGITNFGAYVATLQRIQRCMKKVRKCKMFVLLLHDNARLHTRFAKTRSHLRNWVMLCCPIHRTAQIWPPSDFCLFDPMTNTICG